MTRGVVRSEIRVTMGRKHGRGRHEAHRSWTTDQPHLPRGAAPFNSADLLKFCRLLSNMWRSRTVRNRVDLAVDQSVGEMPIFRTSLISLSGTSVLGNKPYCLLWESLTSAHARLHRNGRQRAWSFKTQRSSIPRHSCSPLLVAITP